MPSTCKPRKKHLSINLMLRKTEVKFVVSQVTLRETFSWAFVCPRPSTPAPSACELPLSLYKVSWYHFLCDIHACNDNVKSSTQTAKSAAEWLKTVPCYSYTIWWDRAREAPLHTPLSCGGTAWQTCWAMIGQSLFRRVDFFFFYRNYLIL